MRWWADDADFQSDSDIGTPDVFVFGGIIVPDGCQVELEKNVRAIKAKYGHERAPIKWNFKDAHRFYGTNDASQKILDSMHKNVANWRSEIFEALAVSQVKILVTAIEAYSADKDKVIAVRNDCSKRAFANGLMRYAMHAREQSENADVVIDWPAGDDRTPFNEEYSSAFIFGKNTDGQAYSAGPLHKLPMADSVFFSSTRYSCMLQIADLVVGANRDFLRACLLKKDYGPGFAMIKKIRDRYRGAPHYISGRGLNVSSGNGNFRHLVGQAVAYDLFDRPRPRPVELPF